MFWQLRLRINLFEPHTNVLKGMMALSGAGTGMRFMPGSLHGIGFFPNNIASVIALTSFAVPFGGTIAMTIMDTVFNNKAGSSGSNSSSNSTASSGMSSSNFIQSISSLPPEAQAAIRNAAKKGIVWAFIAILPCMWLCVVAAAFLGNVRITRKRKTDEQGRTDFSENVTDSSFLLRVFQKKFGGKKERSENAVVGSAKTEQEAEKVHAAEEVQVAQV